MADQNKKSLLVVEGDAFDVTGKVQIVEAYDDEGLKARGVGIVIFRSNHIFGNATIFLKLVGTRKIFGETCEVYTIPDNWKSWDYARYTMKADESDAMLEISYVDHALRKLHVMA
ncbi:VHS1010 protein [Vibrio phage 1]|nr:VHS1010 protein [Vibrio phage 1]